MTDEARRDLYKLLRSEMFESFKIHRAALQHYLTLAVAVLGATIAGSTQLAQSSWLGALLLAGPIVNTFICILGMRMCDRYYLGALERISIVAKLEEECSISERAGQQTVFAQDSHLLPERWVVKKWPPTANVYIDEHMKKGVNRLARRTFWSFIILNALLAMAILLQSLG